MRSRAQKGQFPQLRHGTPTLPDILELRAELAAHYDLAPSLEAAEATRDIYERMDRVVPLADWAIFAPYVIAINRLKAERNAVILGHNYMTPEIYHGVADFVGDSLQLAIKATEVEADVIVQCGVHFMAETSKIMNPSKIVLMPDMAAGCSLAESISAKGVADVHELYTAADLRAYRESDPEVKIIAHPECTPEVVAEADFTGSTKDIIDWVHAHKPPKAMLVTECSMAANISDELPEVEFAKPCNMCPYMKMITLEKILYALHSMTGQVEIDPAVAVPARRAVQRMIDISRKVAV
jgi:quinolinate synthase